MATAGENGGTAAVADSDIASAANRGAFIAAVVHNAGFAGNDLVTAIAIAKAESGWNPTVISPLNKNNTHDYGLFQINSSHYPSNAVRTHYIDNAKYAHKLYAGRGNKFGDWSSYNSGAYAKFVPDAQAAVTKLRANGSTWERAAIIYAAKVDSGAAKSPTIQVDPSSPLAKVGGALDVSGALSNFTGAFAGFASNLVSVIIAVVLLVLGVVLLMHNTVKGAVKTVAKVAP